MFARTERLLLRPAWPEDAKALTEAIADEAIVRNLATAPWPYDERDARSFISGQNKPLSNTFMLFQRTAANPRLIGSIGLEPISDDVAELGYWIARPYWGLGFATEAGRHMVQLAGTLGYSRIMASHFADNPASGVVLRKLGFRATGRRLPRASAARGGTATAVEYQHDALCCAVNGSVADPLVAAMRCGTSWPAEKRENWRQYAA